MALGDQRKQVHGVDDFKNFSGSRFEGFRIPLAQWGRSAWLDESSYIPSIRTGDPFDFGGISGNGGNNDGKRTAAWVQRGLENLIYITFGATVTPVVPLALGVDVFKFWAAETTPKNGFDPDSRIIWKKEQSRDLGWEIDLTAKWTWSKNFSVTGAFVPWFPGDFFKVPKGRVRVSDPGHPGTSVFSEVEKTSNPSWGYVARANCVFTF